jgi:hypothetical protein
MAGTKQLQVDTATKATDPRLVLALPPAALTCVNASEASIALKARPGFVHLVGRRGPNPGGGAQRTGSRDFVASSNWRCLAPHRALAVDATGRVVHARRDQTTHGSSAARWIRRRVRQRLAVAAAAVVVEQAAIGVVRALGIARAAARRARDLNAGCPHRCAHAAARVATVLTCAAHAGPAGDTSCGATHALAGAARIRAASLARGAAYCRRARGAPIAAAIGSRTGAP